MEPGHPRLRRQQMRPLPAEVLRTTPTGTPSNARYFPLIVSTT
jgi:hypothetical protein